MRPIRIHLPQFPVPPGASRCPYPSGIIDPPTGGAAMARAVLQPLATHIRQLTAAADDDGRLLRRFLDDRDQAAFAALVRRHGPLVLSACRVHLAGADVDD